MKSFVPSEYIDQEVKLIEFDAFEYEFIYFF